MNIAVAEPAVHPSGLRVFARQINRRERGFRKIDATTETAGRSAGTLIAGLEKRPIARPTGRIPGFMMPWLYRTNEPAARIKTSLSEGLVDDLLATWDGGDNPYEPGQFPGGLPKPQEYFPADPDYVPPPFPTPEEQAPWLGPDAADFCRRYARGERA